MEGFIQEIRKTAEGSLDGVSDAIILSMAVVAGLIVIMSVFALIVSICLGISYAKYNKRDNSLHLTGEQIARNILDRNGLHDIMVSKNGSFLFGNSYSHYFKKVRLRRRTWQKMSVSSLAMAAQKSSLALLDKQGDPDMKARIKMTPFIYFGPLAYIPLVVVGSLLDLFIIKTGSGTMTIAFTAVGTVIYLLSFIMSLMVLKTEKKAQALSLDVMKNELHTTDEEIMMCRKLFRLYNIEYVNDMIIALLELLYRVLQIVAYVENAGSSSSSK